MIGSSILPIDFGETTTFVALAVPILAWRFNGFLRDGDIPTPKKLIVDAAKCASWLNLDFRLGGAILFEVGMSDGQAECGL